MSRDVKGGWLSQVTLTKHVPTYIEVQYKHSVGT